MFYYFEGPDGAGKSTLARSMAQEVIHFGPLLDKTSAELYDLYTRAINYASKRLHIVALDRGPVSEWVYGNEVRGVSRLRAEDVQRLERKVDGLGGLRVYVTAAYGVLAERTGRRDEYADAEGRIATRTAYEEWCKTWPCRIDTTNLELK